MSKIEKYLGIANHDIQVANNSNELKSYVASILCEIDELQQENKQLKDNWNELKEFMSYENISRLFDMGYDANDFINEIEGKIKELEEAGIGGK